MFDPDQIAPPRALRAAGEGGALRAFPDRQPESRPEYRPLSGLPLKRVYPAEDLAEFRHEDLGLPGQYPYTRGPYPTMYRGRLWTMRQIAGFGTGEDTNGRFRYLIEQGQTGLSVDFDMPTLMGYDSDDPRSLGEVGREGVAVDTLDDVETLFASVDLERIAVSMTINPTAWILLAMYVALAQSRSLDLNRLSGTVQADILKEYIAQKEWAFPIRPSMRIMRDMIVWSARNMARYNPINISGYHISEAAATPVHEGPLGAGAGLHHGQRGGLRGGGDARRGARGRVLPAPRLLLRLPERLLRGDREVPGGPTHLRPTHEGALRGAQAGVHAAALPLPDRGGHPHPRPAHEQRGAHSAAGALRSAGRRPVPPHQRPRRGLRHSLRGGDEACPAHPADHRGGEPDRARDRPAGRILLPGIAHQRHRAPRLRHPRQGRRPRRNHQGGGGRLLPEGNRRLCLRDGAAAGLGRAAAHRRQSIRGARGTRARAHPQG